MIAERNHIKVFVASSVYHFEHVLRQVHELLDSYGYDVLMSHMGTILLDSSKSNVDNCLHAVREADVFVGFIRPDYGTGIVENGGKSITHLEFDTARGLGIPRFVLADHRVVFTRSLFRGSFVVEDSQSKRIHFENISFEKNKVMDTRSIRMYNEAIQDREKEMSKRTGNWVQEFVSSDDVKMHLESQFRYPDRIRRLIQGVKGHEK